MKQIKLSAFISTLIAGLLLVNCGSSRQVPQQISFFYNLQDARQVATAKNQPLILELYRPDCPWCKMLDDSTFSNPMVIEMSEKMTFAKINAERDSAVADLYGVSYYPTIVVARANGTEIDRLVGYYPPADFFNEVQLYLQGNETLADYLERLVDEPERVDYNLIVADRYRNRSDWDKALQYYTNVLKFSDPDSTAEAEKALFEIGGVQMEKGKFAIAAKAYSDFIARYPESSLAEDAVRRIPYCLAKNGEYKKALEQFQLYLNEHPRGKYSSWVSERIDSLSELMP